MSAKQTQFFVCPKLQLFNTLLPRRPSNFIHTGSYRPAAMTPQLIPVTNISELKAKKSMIN